MWCGFRICCSLMALTIVVFYSIFNDDVEFCVELYLIAD